MWKKDFYFFFISIFKSNKSILWYSGNILSM